MAKFSVKRPFTVFVAVVVVLLLGVVSFMRMTTDLLPQFNIPYVMVITTYPGASPEKVESTVTEPLEAQLGKQNGVKNVMSTSSENVSMITLEYEEDTNMDSALVKMASAIDLVALPDEAGTPMTMEMSMDMMATMYVSVAYEGMDIYELTDFVQDVVTPEMERQNGVASVEEMGAVNKSVEIRLLEDEVDALNDKLAAQVNSKLAETKAELDKAQAELDKAKGQIADSKDALNEQQTATSTELAEASKLVDQALATQAAYQANLTTLQASKQALEMEYAAYEEVLNQF
ncbi:MAG: efflux RND transporter permease subunit, partial [Eubacterium sp.]|nr:efflux RND transporter permease subunit [Eubacterium sp.]